MRKKQHFLNQSALVALCSLCSAGAYAQGTPAGEGGVEEIMVFAQKRAAGENAQTVPIAITAFSEAGLRDAHVDDILELGRLAPNVQTETVGTTPGLINITIRGIGLNGSIRSIDPAVNVVVDGMSLGYQAGAVADTFDLQSVEILRGPQGVLFGRNATGGALVLRTAPPSNDFHFRAKATVGNFNEFDGQAAVEGPIVKDKILAKLAVSMKYNDGYFKNTNDGIFSPSTANPSGAPVLHETGNIPKTRELVIKPTFLFNFNDDHRLTLFTQYQRYADGGTVASNFIAPPSLGAPVALQTVYGFTPTAKHFETNTANPGYAQIEAEHVIAQFDDKIGAGSLTTIAAYRQIEFKSTIDVTGSPFVLTVLPDNKDSNHQVSLESRYNVGLTDKLHFLAGIYGFSGTTSVLEKRLVSGGAVTPNLLTYVMAHWKQVDDTAAAFVNFDYKILDRLTLSAGTRYGWERKHMSIAPLTNCIGQSFSNCPQNFVTGSKQWFNLSPRFALSYQATDDVLFYASYTQGFRSGNYNGRATTPQAALTPANPESVKSYEAGLKSELFDRKVRLNLAGYYVEYNQIQAVLTANIAGPITQFLINAASATVKGIELEGTWLPFKGLKLQGTAGWTKASFDKFTVALPAGVVGTALKFPRVPEWTAGASADYTFQIAPLDGDFNLHADYSWRSGVYSDLINTPSLFIEGYGLINAEASYKTDRWRFSLYCKNLDNQYYVENNARSFSYAEYAGAPRTYGLQVSFTY